MLNELIKRKINSVLQHVCEDTSGQLHINKWQGTIQKLDLRLNKTIVDLLCPLLGMPMTFFAGRIAKLTIQVPWSTLLKDEMRVVLDGVYILCQTTEQLNPEYFRNNRRKYIEQYIRTYLDANNEIESRKNKYLEKLQEFVFGKLSLEVRNVHLCLENVIERPFYCGLTTHRATIRNLFKGDIHKATLEIQGIGAYLNVVQSHVGSTPAQRFESFMKRADNIKQRKYVVQPTNVLYQRTNNKGKGQVHNLLSFKPVKIQINNQSADLLRLLVRLIEWHSCVNKTCIYREKFTRSNIKAVKWWQFLRQIIWDQVKESKLRRKFMYLQFRREYIKNYMLLYKGRYFINKYGPNNSFLKLSEYNDLHEKIKNMEDKLELFEIIEYRKYAELLARKNHELQTTSRTIKRKQTSWFMAYFSNNSPQTSDLKLLEQTANLSTLQTIKISSFTFSVQQVCVDVVVKIQSHQDPFLKAEVEGFSFRRLKEKEVQKKTFEIQDMSVSYAEYLGHDKQYRRLWERRRGKEQGDDEEDEFRDFKKSILLLEEVTKTEKTQTKFRLEPFVFVLNDETVDKLMLFKQSRPRSSTRPALELNRSIIYNQTKQNLGMTSPSCISCWLSFQIIIPQSLYQKSTEIHLRLQSAQLNISTQSDGAACYNMCVSLDNMYCELVYMGKDNKEQVTQYLMERFNMKCDTNVVCLEDQKAFQGRTRVCLSDINLKADYKEIQIILYLSKRYSRFLTRKSKKKIHNRRKPSLGQQFLDAVENLTDVVYHRSASGSQDSVKRSRSLFNFRQTSDNIMLLLKQLIVDFSCPAFRLGYYIAGKLNNSVDVETVSAMVKKNGNRVDVTSFANSLSVKVKQYINFADSINKIVIFKEKNLVMDDQSNQIKENPLANVILSLNASINSATVELYSKQNLLFLLTVSCSAEGVNLTQLNRQLKSILTIKFESKKPSRQPHMFEVIHPFKVRSSISQNQGSNELNVETDEIVLNLNDDLLVSLYEFIAGVIGDTKNYRIVNKLNVPVQVKSRTNNSIEVPAGREHNIRVASNASVEYTILGVKYIHVAEEPKQKWTVSSSACLIRQAKLQKDTTVLTFKSNIRFTNQLASSIHLTVFRKELGFEDCQLGTRFRRISAGIIRPGNDIYLLCEEIKALEFQIRLDNETGLHFQQVDLQTLLKQCQQKLLIGSEQYIVLCPETKELQGMNQHSIFISCPLQISNFLPGSISLRFNKQSFDFSHWTQASSSRRSSIFERSRSVQMIALEEVRPLDSYASTTMALEDIQGIYIQFGEYCKSFKLDLKYERLEQGEHNKNREIEIIKVISLSNGKGHLNILCKMCVKRQSIRIFFMSDLAVFNVLDFTLSLRVKEEGYFYNEMRANSNPQKMDLFQMSDDSYNSKETLRQLFEGARDSIILFTGNAHCSNRLLYFNDNDFGYQQSLPDSQIQICRQGHTAFAFARKISVNFGLTLIFMYPLCTVINRSSCSLFVRSCEIEKNVRPQDKEAITTFSSQYVRLGVKGGIETARNEEFVVNTDALGIVYFRRELSKEAGHYRFFRVLTARSDYQTNILVEDSEYPPITFINKIKEKIRISELGLPGHNEQPQEIPENGALQYALLNPYKNAHFRISIYNYEYSILKDNLEFKQPTEIFQCFDKRNRRKIYITTETFKDKRVVLIGYSKQLGLQIQKGFRNQKQQVLRVTFNIKQFGISLLTSSHRECGYFQFQSLAFDYRQKSRHSTVSLYLQDFNLFNYTNIQPHVLASVQHNAALLDSLRSSIGWQKPNKSFFSVTAKYNFDSNVRVVKAATVDMLPILIQLDVKFVIDVVQNLMPMVGTVRKLLQLVGPRLAKVEEMIVNRPAETLYIVEAMRMGEIRLELSFEHLETLLEVYEGSTMISLLISFLDNMGKLKPFRLPQIQLQYQNVSLTTFQKMFRMRDNIRQIVSQIMLRPAKQIHATLLALMGFSSQLAQQSSLISSSISTSLYVVKTIFKNMLSGQRLSMNQLEVSNADVLAKLNSLKYWPRLKGDDKEKKVVEFENQPRYERYARNRVQPYDKEKCIVKYVCDLHSGVKSRANIYSVWRLSATYIIAICQYKIVIINEGEGKAHIVSPTQVFDIDFSGQDLRIRLIDNNNPRSIKDITINSIIIKRPTITHDQNIRLNHQIRQICEQEAFFFG